MNLAYDPGQSAQVRWSTPRRYARSGAERVRSNLSAQPLVSPTRLPNVDSPVGDG